MDHPFDRPVFIVAAPRSCSTLLFETLTKAEALWSLGDESHQVFEGHRKLSPGRGAVDSNRLTADVLEPALARSITTRFANQVRDCHGNAWRASAHPRIRLLEKTPKNALRIPFLDALFPDALFVYLVRDPRANIASIIEAWRARGFVTYPRIRTAHGPWSLLLPPGWRERVERPLEEIAAFQWCAANRFIIDDLTALGPQRWIALSADDLLRDPAGSVSRLCAFMQIEFDAALRQSLARPLPKSRYTVSAPDQDKWRRHAEALQRAWPEVARVIDAINAFAGAGTLVDTAAELAAAVAAIRAVRDPAGARIARNQPCPCGSGRRYKACHGSLDAAVTTRGEA